MEDMDENIKKLNEAVRNLKAGKDEGLSSQELRELAQACDELYKPLMGQVGHDNVDEEEYTYAPYLWH